MTGEPPQNRGGRPLGNTGLHVSRLGFGAVKIGRTEGLRYRTAFDLPDDAAVARLLHGLLDLGITLIDTAPAYGLSEARIGQYLASRRHDFTLSTKVGETFHHGVSRFDFTPHAMRASVEQSLRHLRTDTVDILLLHSDGDDLKLLHDTDAVATLQAMKHEGKARAIGLSGKTVAGAEAALAWADVLMVPYHTDDRSHAAVIAQASAQGLGIMVKKALASGTLPPDEALRFLAHDPHVDTAVVGSLSTKHLAENLAAMQ